MENSNNKGFNRRQFLESTALASIGLLGASAMIAGCKNTKDAKALGLPPILRAAPKGKKLRAGLVGVGNRGTGAAMNFISCGPDLQIVALADVFQDRIDDSVLVFQNRKWKFLLRTALHDLTDIRN